jgi:hypothetical protein
LEYWKNLIGQTKQTLGYTCHRYRYSQKLKNLILIIIFRFLDDGKKAIYFPLAPIAVEILPIFFREIATDSGTMFPKMTNLSAPKLIIELRLKQIKNPPIK